MGEIQRDFRQPKKDGHQATGKGNREDKKQEEEKATVENKGNIQKEIVKIENERR